MTHASDSAYMALLAVATCTILLEWLLDGWTQAPSICVSMLWQLLKSSCSSFKSNYYVHTKLICNKFSQTRKSVDFLPLIAERILLSCCVWCMRCSFNNRISHGIIRILNYRLWSLPSQPVGLIELLAQNLILSACTNTNHYRLIGHSKVTCY